MTITLELAQRIVAQRFEDLPPQAVHWAKSGILDTVGATLAGCHEDTARLAERALGSGSGPSLVFGSNRRISALDAAVVNGAASHALDFDDCNNTIGGHPSAPVLSAIFALADDIGTSGKDFINAYVTGFEAECKIALAVNFHHYTKGWHPTATMGVFGAATACACLLGLNEHQTSTALAIAASFASGIKANFGTMMKPFHVGHAARNGLYAALLARENYTANTANAFEHKQGFFNVFNGEGNYDASKIIPAWASPWDIVDPGIAVKQYPCCGSTHPAIDAMLMLARDHDIKPDQVARIDSWTHSRRLEHTNRPDPKGALDAKFSVQYCLARAVLERKVIIEHFEGDAYKDAKVRAVLPRVHAAAYTTAQFPADNHFGAEIKVTMVDGKVHTQKVDQPFGRTSRNPLPPELLQEKFVNCSLRALPQANVDGIYETIQRLDQVASMRELIALTAVEDKGSRRPAVVARA